MKKFEMPELHIKKFKTENIVTLSGETLTINEQAEGMLNNADGSTPVAAIFEFTI